MSSTTKSYVVVERYTDNTFSTLLLREIYRFCREVVAMHPDAFRSPEAVRAFIRRGASQKGSPKLLKVRKGFRVYRETYPADIPTTAPAFLKIPKRTRKRKKKMSTQ